MARELKCPTCNTDLFWFGNKRIVWHTHTGISRSSLARRSKLARVYQCPKCKRLYAILTRKQIVTEVHLASTTTE